MKIPRNILVALAVMAALVLARECGRRQGVEQARATQRDIQDDSTVVLLRREAADSQKAFKRQRDSTGRVIRNLNRRIGEVIATEPEQHRGTQERGQRIGLPVETGASASACAGAPVVCDSLIAAHEAGRQQDSLALLFWQRQVAQRDSLLTTVRTARDGWRKLAQRPSYLVTDVGGGAIAGWGLSEKNATVVVVGAGVVLVPRLWGAIRGIL